MKEYEIKRNIVNSFNKNVDMSSINAIRANIINSNYPDTKYECYLIIMFKNKHTINSIDSVYDVIKKIRDRYEDTLFFHANWFTHISLHTNKELFKAQYTKEEIKAFNDGRVILDNSRSLILDIAFTMILIDMLSYILTIVL